jgi:radical SAM protein with 4Fe4S-binding SPASM domain
MVECPSSVNGTEYFTEFCRKVNRLRVPISGALEFTQRCNLRCVHCYLGSARYGKNPGRSEMDTRKVFSLLDEIRDAGCLYLLITGGEPLLRPDFGEVYERAKNNGMVVTVFTNGTLVNRKVADLFADLPPHIVEISLYGATQETYERVTGVPGSFRACLNGIEELLKTGISLTIKTILMSVNSHEFYDIERIAKSYGVKFRFDAAIFPRFDGDMSPLSLRVPVDDALDKELSDESRFAEWKNVVGRHGDVKLSDTLYSCGAGVTNFHVDPEGFLMPCLMVKHFRHDLFAGSFAEGWGKMARLSALKAKPERHCSDCSAVILCGYCPAFFMIENGDENLHSDYLCDLGKGRYSAVCSSK